MAYGTVKVDNITFTNGGVDQTITVSGIVQSISGDITATGTIQAATIVGTSTVSGTTVTGNTGRFTVLTGDTAGFTTVTGTTVTGTNANFVNGLFTTQVSGTTVRGTTVSGATVTGTAGQFGTLTGNTAGFTTVTGTTVTGSIANFVSGVFTTQISGATITGNLAQFTTLTGNTAGFTTVTGTTVTGTTANFVTISGTTITGGAVTVASGIYTGNVTAAAFIPTGSTAPTNGLYLPSANSVALSTNGTGRLFISSAGLVGIGTSNVETRLHIRDTNSGATTTPLLVQNRGLNAGTKTQIALIATQSDLSDGGYAAIQAITGGAGSLAHNLAFLTCTSGGVPTERLYITSAGNVGIGTTSPDTVLTLNVPTVTTGFDRLLRFYRNQAGGYGSSDISQYYNSGSDYGLSIGLGQSSELNGNTAITFSRTTSTTGDIRFISSGQEGMRLDSSRRLLVGTSSSASVGISQYARLQIQGNTFGSPEYGILSIQRSEAATAITSGEDIGRISFTDNTGADFAQITCAADGNAGAGDYPGRLVFSTTADGAASPTERLRITSTGQVRLAGAGITFNGDTAAANELDDYEEGTWTPAANVGTLTSNATATYTKIGRTVTVFFDVTMPTQTDGNSARLDGLPFNPGSAGAGVALGYTTYGAAVTMGTGFLAGSSFSFRDISGNLLTLTNVSGKRFAGACTYSV